MYAIPFLAQRALESGCCAVVPSEKSEYASQRTPRLPDEAGEPGTSGTQMQKTRIVSTNWINPGIVFLKGL